MIKDNILHADKAEILTKIMEALSLGAVLQYTIYRFLQSTMFSFYYSNTYKLITMGLLVVFGGLRWLWIFSAKWKVKNFAERKRTLFYCLSAALLASPFFYVGWKQDYKLLIFIPICCMCLYDMKAEKVLKAFFAIIGSLLIATVLCSLSGTVRNLVYTQNNGHVISAYGIINTTDFASYTTFLLLIAWCGMNDHDWKIGILYAAMVSAVAYIVYQYTDSRTALYSGILTVLLILWDSIEVKIPLKRDLKWPRKTSRFILCTSFPLIGMIVVILVLGYAFQTSWGMEANTFLSGRLSSTVSSYSEYGIHPFGAAILNMHGQGSTLFHNWSSGYGYLDIAYAMLLIRYGWVVTVVVSGLWIWMTHRALNNGNRRIALAMMVIALHAFSEARFLDVNYNIFLVMPLCSMTQRKNEKLVEKSKEWKENRIKIILGIVAVFIIFTILPRMMSWLRTFFAGREWNSGMTAMKSLIFCTLLVIIVFVIWKSLSQLFSERKKTAFMLLLVALFVGVGSASFVNAEINKNIELHKERLSEEEGVIEQVVNLAELPVYAAESSEYYSRGKNEVSDHFFSTDETSRSPKGSIFTDIQVNSLGILTSGGLYTSISDRTGLYSFDSAVIRGLSESGYRWKTFNDGWKSCNLADTAAYNDIKFEKRLMLSKSKRVITSNTETDQLGGLYEVNFIISKSSDSENSLVAIVEVLGEAGERVIIKKELYSHDFDLSGRCECKLQYIINSTPKVSYAVTSVAQGEIYVDEITWRQLDRFDYTDGVHIETNGIISFETGIQDNKFNKVCFQLYDESNINCLLEFGVGKKEVETINGSYTFDLQNGKYFLRLKGNTNLSDEWLQKPMYIQNGTVFHYEYMIDKFFDDQIVLKDTTISISKD